MCVSEGVCVCVCVFVCVCMCVCYLMRGCFVNICTVPRLRFSYCDCGFSVLFPQL